MHPHKNVLRLAFVVYGIKLFSQASLSRPAVFFPSGYHKITEHGVVLYLTELHNVYQHIRST